MTAQRHAAIPLTLLFGLVVLQGGAIAGWWPEPSLQMLLPLAGLGWLVGLWLQREARPAAGPPIAVVPPEALPPPPPPSGHERRRSQRFDVRVPVTLEVATRGRLSGELRDISQGGARIAGIAGLEPDSYGLLRVTGISLPVPCVVLDSTPQAELRLRFELNGLALNAFLGQLDRLVTDATETSPP